MLTLLFMEGFFIAIKPSATILVYFTLLKET
jgi:hypothetical protein